jgi:hypothetical protein
MKVVDIFILKEAIDDLEEGKNFYNQNEQGVGDYFWDSLISDIESLVIFAGIHNRQYGYYRMLAKRFPYAVYYEIKDAIVYVVAVLPVRRSPEWVYKKLKKRR